MCIVFVNINIDNSLSKCEIKKIPNMVYTSFPLDFLCITTRLYYILRKTSFSSYFQSRIAVPILYKPYMVTLSFPLYLSTISLVGYNNAYELSRHLQSYCWRIMYLIFIIYVGINSWKTNIFTM